VVSAAGLHVGGRRTARTRYRPDPWALPEWLVAGSGAVAAAAVFVGVRLSPADFFLASPTQVPPVPLLACAGILVALLPAVVAPPLPQPADPGGTGTRRPDPVEVAA
jgi:energy-coupling factor transport system permease protein